MPVAIPNPPQTLVAKDQPAEIPDRVLKEFAALRDLIKARDGSSDPFEFEASIDSRLSHVVNHLLRLRCLRSNQVVQGYFRQSDPSLVKFSPEQVLEAELGMLETHDDRWEMFKTDIAGKSTFQSLGAGDEDVETPPIFIPELNKNAPKGTCYKVLFCSKPPTCLSYI